MGIIQKQAFRNTVINYIGTAIGFINVLFIFRILLSQEEFGLTRLVISLIILFSRISSFGISRIIIKFFPIFRVTPHKNNGLLLISLALSGIGFLIVTGLYYVFKIPILKYYQDDAMLFDAYYFWIPVAALGYLLFIIFESFLQSLKKTVFTNLLQTIIMRLYWLIAVLGYSFEFYSFYLFMIFYMLGYFVVVLLCILQLIKNKEFTFDFNIKYTRKRVLQPLVNYGFYTLFSSVLMTIVSSVDILMIGALMPEEKLKSVGIYAIASYIVALIFIPKNALARITAPIIAADWKKRDIEKIGDIYTKSALILVFLGGVVAGCILLNIDELLSFFPKYTLAKNIIIILGISRLLDMFFGLNHDILVITKFYRTEFFLGIFLLALVIITNYIFIPLYGITGAALTTGAMVLSYNIILLIYLWLKLKIQPFTKNTFILISFGLFAAGVTYFLPLSIENEILRILIKSSVFVSLYISPVYYFKLSLEINDMIDKFIRQIKGLGK